MSEYQLSLNLRSISRSVERSIIELNNLFFSGRQFSDKFNLIFQKLNNDFNEMENITRLLGESRFYSRRLRNEILQLRLNFIELQRMINSVSLPRIEEPEDNVNNNENLNINLNDIDDEIEIQPPKSKKVYSNDNQDYQLIEIQPPKSKKVYQDKYIDSIFKFNNQLKNLYNKVKNIQNIFNKQSYEYYATNSINPLREDLLPNIEKDIRNILLIIQSGQLVRTLSDSIFNRIYVNLNNNQKEKLNYLLRLWSLSFLNFSYNGNVDTIDDLQFYIFNLLYKIINLPLDLNNRPKYICELQYRSLKEDKILTKRWFLHPYTIKYMLNSILKFITGQRIIIQREEDESDFAVLLNDYQRLETFSLYTYETFIRYKDTIDIDKSMIRTPKFYEYEFGKYRRTVNQILVSQIITSIDIGMTLNETQLWFIDRIKKMKSINIRREEHKSGFFPYYHNTKINLIRYQIASNPEDFIKYKDIFETNCFIHTLSLTGLFTESQIHELKIICYSRVISLKKLLKVAEIYNLKIILKKFQNSRFRKYEIGIGENIIKLVLYDTHIMLEERTSITRRDLEINDTNNRCFTTSGLIKFMISHDMLRPIKLCDVISLNLSIYKDIKKDQNYEYLGDITYSENLGIKKFNEKEGYPISFYALNSTQKLIKNKELKMLTFYADFEAFTVDEYSNLKNHKAFMCCISHNLTDDICTFDGDECGKRMLDYIVDQILISREYYPLVYIHNLGYDIHFFAKYGIVTDISRGHKMLTAEILYRGLRITFKDSYSIIPVKLDKFHEIFGLEDEKELFPYDYYTEDRYYKDQVIIIIDILDHMKGRWSDEENQQFINNVEKIWIKNNPDKNPEDYLLNSCGMVNLRNYAEYYCKKDVSILKQGLNIFKSNIYKDFKINIENYLSISSIAAGIFYNKVYSKNDNLFLTGGIVREFLSYAIHGGRVMTNSNKKWYFYVKGLGLVDFDAVSLYPSAIARLYLVEGPPKVFTQEELNPDNILTNPKYTAFVLEIIITKVGKHRQFPLIPIYNMEKNHIEYTNAEHVRVFVSDIELKDMIEFQKIEFIPIRGYYWDGKRDYRVQKMIRKIFNKRVEYQIQENPIQNVYKLILNSIYGKTIIKPHVKSTKYYYYDTKDYESFINKNSQDIIQMNQVYDSNIIKFDYIKPICKHFNFSLFGIHILSMSKRIMNEVMCLAEDLGIMIYYQDTDSMHIEKDKLNLLAEEYKKKYNRDLIGSDLGQFHSDFKLNNSKDVWSTEAYFLGKKAYVDKLKNKEGDEGYHIRMKGIPEKSIKAYAEEHYDGDVMKIYEELYNGKEIEFNLLANYQFKFEYAKNMTIRNKDTFYRKIKFE